jgi:ABC-2 type transport system permease protein
MMEIMVNAATPRDLLVGKVIGVLVAGMCQLVPMVLAGALAFALQPRVADALDITLVSSFDFDLAAVSVKAVLVFLVYFILGYVLIGAMFAAAGSTISRQEEVNQAVGPAIILIVAGLFLGYFVVAMPDSLAAKVMFLIPLTSPYVALPRIMLGDPSALEIALSIAILAISGVLAMMMAAMVYRTGVLMYGQKGGIIGALRMRKRQQVAR